MKELLEKLEDLIYDSHTIGIFFHTYPDWDCLGSAFALRQIILDNCSRKHVKVFGDRKGKLFFLGLSLIGTSQVVPKNHRRIGSLAIVVDTWKKDKIDKSELLRHFERVVIIDHHEPYDKTAILENDLYIKSNDVSCAELILKITDQLGWHVSEDTASLLYCGVFGDSQGFTNPNITPEVFNTAGRLMQLGAQVQKINHHLEKKDLIHEKLRAQLIFLGKLKGKIFTTVLDRDILDLYKARFNNDTRLFYLIHSINIRGADVVAIWFKYMSKLVICFHTDYKQASVLSLGYVKLRNNDRSFSFFKVFKGIERTLEEEMEMVMNCLFQNLKLP